MIELYLSPECPFCRKVERATAELGLIEGTDFSVIDASPGSVGRMTVKNLGGRSMVPFLVHGDSRMYESDDIIAYLKERTGT